MSEVEVNKQGLALEVLVDSKEPKIYLLNKSEILIGSLDSSDIVINQSEISRKHLKLFFVNNLVYVNDQGSTNGTFLNDTKLVPGKRVEFTPFMSVRLGSKVLLTLISKERPDVTPDMSMRESFIEEVSLRRSADDKTRVISLKELHAAKTQKIQKKRQDNIAKKRLESQRMRQEKAALKHVASIAGVWLLIGLVLNVIWLSLPDKTKRIFGVREKREVVIHVMDEAEESGIKIPRDILLSRTTLQTFLGSLGCRKPEEKIICQNIPVFLDGRNGVVRLRTSYLMMLEQKKVIENFSEFMNITFPSYDLTAMNKEMLHRAAFLYFTANELAVNLTPLGDTPIYFVLYAETPDKLKLQSVSALRSILIPQIKKSFDNIRDIGLDAFMKSHNDFYHHY
jgi:hypothetical protein